jgi:hypothetical protein
VFFIKERLSHRKKNYLQHFANARHVHTLSNNGAAAVNSLLLISGARRKDLHLSINSLLKQMKNKIKMK